jgi:uncharacterized protein (DUF433 family)
MTDEQLLARIVLQPEVLAGKPVIQGTRLAVDFILNLMGHGASVEDILAEYRGLSREDIAACLLFAARSLQSTAFMSLAAKAA